MFLKVCKTLALILGLLIATSNAYSGKNLKTVYEWKYIDYLWDSPAQKQQYISNGDYNYENIVPIDVDRARDGRVFVTAIRNTGVPASLATVTNIDGPSGPLLKPYPNWSWFKKGDCDGITSVYRVTMDECNNMYVLDTGYIGNDYTCPAQVLIFDLRTDKLIRRIRVPQNIAHNSNGIGKLVTPVIQARGKDCRLKNLFMADVNGRGLVMYNAAEGFSRLEHEIMNPLAPFNNVSVAGETFTLEDSLMGMAVTPESFSGRQKLIFRPFSSTSMYAADSRSLQWASSHGGEIKYSGSRDMLPSQATAMGVSSKGTLFFGLTREIAIGCWDTSKAMVKSNVNIAVRDYDRLQFASGLKVIPRSRTGKTEEVWVSSNRLQKVMAGTQNFREVNFRVLKASVADLVRNTKC